MKCPFCDAKMTQQDGRYICPGNGPLLIPERPVCPFKGDYLTKEEIDEIAVRLIDLEME